MMQCAWVGGRRKAVTAVEIETKKAAEAACIRNSMRLAGDVAFKLLDDEGLFSNLVFDQIAD